MNNLRRYSMTKSLKHMKGGHLSSSTSATLALIVQLPMLAMIESR